MRIAMVAGESSGDRLGAGLIEQLKARIPQAEFRGIGGDLMINAGLQSTVPMERLSRMGLVEVFRHLPELLGIRRRLRQQLLDWQPDVFIGIDAPDFNLGLARNMRRAGVPTVHYVSPTVWAWRPKRVQTLRKAVDLVLCIFPFEPAILQSGGVQAHFVGHPLAQKIPLAPEREPACMALGIDPARRWIAILPGSRRAEVQSLGADFLHTAERLLKTRPDLGVLVPLANRGAREELSRVCDAESISFRPVVVDGHSTEVLCAADAVLTASGTATLETMLCKRPMVVAYRVNALTYQMAKRLDLIKTPYIAQPNILLGEAVVPEYVQDDVRPEILAKAMQRALEDKPYRERLRRLFTEQHKRLRIDADAEAACSVLRLLGREQQC